MKLDVMERIVLSGLLPQEGNFKTLKLLRVLREDLSFNDIENQKLKFVQEAEQVQWNDVGARDIGEVEISIGEIMTETIKDKLKEMDEKKELKNDYFSLYEKFIVE